MPLDIEDYALIGDTQSAALVGVDGSIGWLCLPRFDSEACFAALLGDADHGRWLLAPAAGEARATRRYRGDTLVLETTFTTPDGQVRVVDCMPPRQSQPDVIRVAEGVRGSVDMKMELAPRFDYGRMRPWLRELDGRHSAIAGSEALDVVGDVPPRASNGRLQGMRCVSHIRRARFDQYGATRRITPASRSSEPSTRCSSDTHRGLRATSADAMGADAHPPSGRIRYRCARPPVPGTGARDGSRSAPGPEPRGRAPAPLGANPSSCRTPSAGPSRTPGVRACVDGTERFTRRVRGGRFSGLTSGSQMRW